MVRVGRRPCPSFPRHCFYILSNPQILFIPCLTSKMVTEQLQMRRPRLTRTTWYPKIKMATESSKIETERLKNQLTMLNMQRSKNTSLMSFQLSKCVQPAQVEGQGQTRTRSPSNSPDPNAVLDSLWYMFDSENEIVPRMRSNREPDRDRTHIGWNQKVGWINIKFNLRSLSLNCS